MSIFEYNEEEMKKIRADEYSVGKAENVLDLLEDVGEIPAGLHERILSETDLVLLKKWLKLAAKARTVREFMDQSGLA